MHALALLKLQQRVKKTLEENFFKIISTHLESDNFFMVSSFGKEFEQSTFYVDKQATVNGLIIGASIALDVKNLTKSMLNRIYAIAGQHDVFCSQIKYNNNDEGVIGLHIMYNFLRYNEKKFLLHLEKFHGCIRHLFEDIQKYTKYQDTIYLDLSMFETADWTIFDPYTYVVERDQKYDGSWEIYINSLKTSLNKKERLAELLYVEMCQAFELINEIPIDLACDFIIDTILQYIGEENKLRVMN